jgi:hypothetical protein
VLFKGMGGDSYIGVRQYMVSGIFTLTCGVEKSLYYKGLLPTSTQALSRDVKNPTETPEHRDMFASL